MFIEENMYMRSLRRKRKITIYVPDDYETSNKRYPVLYINDGQNAFFDETSYMIMFKRRTQMLSWWRFPAITV